MKRAGELRLEYRKRDIFCRPTPHEPTGSRTPEPNRNDCLAELLKREHHVFRIGVHPGNVGLKFNFDFGGLISWLSKISLAMFLLTFVSIICPNFLAAQIPDPSGIECVPSPYGCPGDSTSGSDSYNPPRVYQLPRTYQRRSVYVPRVPSHPSAAQWATQLNNEANRLYEAHDFAGAIAMLRRALTLTPSDKVLRRNLAIADRALKTTHAVRLNNEALALSKRGNVSDAIAKLRRALALAPWHKTIKNNLAITQENFRNALANKKIEEGHALEERGDLEGAMTKYREALRIDRHSNAKIFINLTEIRIAGHSYRQQSLEHGLKAGKALIEEGDLQGAKEKYLELIAFDKLGQSAELAAFRKNLAQAEVELGTALRRLDDFNGAMERYREAMRIDPALEASLSSEVTNLEAETTRQAGRTHPMPQSPGMPTWAKDPPNTSRKAVVEINAPMMAKAQEIYEQASAAKQTAGRWIMDRAIEQVKEVGAKVIMNQLEISQTYQSEILGHAALVKKFESVSEKYKEDVLSKIVVWQHVTQDAINCLGSTRSDCRAVELEEQHLAAGYVEMGQKQFENWMYSELTSAAQGDTLEVTGVQQDKDEAVKNIGRAFDRFLTRLVRRAP